MRYETFKEWFLKIEGVDHFVFSTVTVIGLVSTHVHSFWAYFLPIVDYIMGLGTFYIGWREGEENDTEEAN